MEKHLGAGTWLAAGKVFREGAGVLCHPRTELEGGLCFDMIGICKICIIIPKKIVFMVKILE